MSLESLLASLEGRVTPVTAVQPSKGNASGRNGREQEAVTGGTPGEDQKAHVTAATAPISVAVTPKPAPIQGCTAVTPVTAENPRGASELGEIGAEKPADTLPGWLLGFTDRVPPDYCSTLAPAQGEVLTTDSVAVAAKLIRETSGGPSTFDDRRRCVQCANLTLDGICQAAAPSMGAMVVAICGYRPDLGRLHRCEGYVPVGDDPDPRPGRERWPFLLKRGGA